MSKSVSSSGKLLVSNFNFNTIIISIIVIIVLFIFNKLITSIFNKLSEKYTGQRIFIKNLIPIIKFIIDFFGVLYIIFGVLNFSKDNLVAFGVSAGVAIGFAVQDVLANFFGGLVIIISRPFNIGDKISIDNYYGEVVDINLLKVMIVTPDDSLISIPSKHFLVSSVSNSNSGLLDCQVVTKINLPLDINIDNFKKVAMEAVMSSQYLYIKKPIVINFKEENKYRPVMIASIKAYVFDHRYEFKFSSDIYERIKKHFKEEME